MKNLFLLLALVVSVGLITDCLHAATFTVTTTNISGPGSLPVIINQANATPGKNVIQFAVTNTLTPAFPLPTITNNVTIIGRTDVSTVISGGGTLPLFAFAAGTTNSLSNLVLANGYTTNNEAAISNASTLAVSSCVITNHSATNGSGGAIINSGVMAISLSVISGNQAGTNGFGGAIINSGSLLISSAIFAGNQAGTGGAIYNSSTLTLDNSQLTGNQAGNGGAIFNAGSLAISILTLSNNSAMTGFGGGIYNIGALTISKSLLVANHATGAPGTPGQSGGNSSGGLVPSGGGGGGGGFGGALFSASGSVEITIPHSCGM